MSVGKANREAVFEELVRIADDVSLSVETLVIFGSVAHDEHDESSDVDVLVVSENFEGVAGARRGSEFKDAWAYMEHGPLSIIGMTPEEYEQKKSSGVLTEVLTGGIALIGEE